MVDIMRIIKVLSISFKDQNGLFHLQVNDCGVEREHHCDEEGYNNLLAQTEIYTLLLSKGCTNQEIQGVFDRISDLQSASFQDGVSEGIEAGYSEATVYPDRG